MKNFQQNALNSLSLKKIMGGIDASEEENYLTEDVPTDNGDDVLEIYEKKRRRGHWSRWYKPKK